MPRFTVHTIETAPEAAKATLSAVAGAWGFVPNLHGVLAESPAALDAYDALWAAVARSGLSPVEQQVAYMAINVFHECEYCTAGHTFLSRKAGMPEDALTALREGRPIPVARLEALRRFAEAVVRERGFVPEAEIDAFLAAGFTKANVLDVVAVAATKTISNYTNHLTGTPKEEFMADPSLAWVAPRNRKGAAA
jgi:uncharacterized peroxidase-related enzyme